MAFQDAKSEKPQGQHTAMLQQQLKKAERHIVTGAFRIARQRELISELEGRGYTELAAPSGELLVSFNELQTLHIANLALSKANGLCCAAHAPRCQGPPSSLAGVAPDAGMEAILGDKFHPIIWTCPVFVERLGVGSV